jgi:3-oxoacyl-[acyl-carrier protein] reductase
MTPLLQNKNAIVYGASGGIGGGVARPFAREGTNLFLAGRARESLEAVAVDITAAGGSAECSPAKWSMKSIRKDGA